MDMSLITREEMNERFDAFETKLDEKFDEFAALMAKHFDRLDSRIDLCATKEDIADHMTKEDSSRLEMRMDARLESVVFGFKPA